jgi:putative membrane protein
MNKRNVVIGVVVVIIVLLVVGLVGGGMMWGRTNHWYGPGMMGGFRQPFGMHMFGGWIVMILFWLLVLGGLALLVSHLVRRGEMPVHKDEAPALKSETPLDIAKRRYASGEIDGEEFERIKQSLMS